MRNISEAYAGSLPEFIRSEIFHQTQSKYGRKGNHLKYGRNLPLFAIPVFVFTSSKVVDSIFQGMLLFHGFRSRAAALDPMRSVYRSDKMKEADVLLAVKDVG